MGNERLDELPRVLCGSLSPFPVALGRVMHRAGYRALDLPFDYVPFRLSKVSELPKALDAMRTLGIRGLGLSMPFKEAALGLVDEIDELAKRVGALNTVVNEQSRLVGYNTDVAGAVGALREVTPLVGRRVCLIGAGGAARAVLVGLLDEGAIVHVVNRTRARAEILERDLPSGSSASFGLLSEPRDAVSFDILINATPAGMAGHGPGLELPPALLQPPLVVMDLIYKPVRSALIEIANGARCRSVHGGRMLLHQAARQFELYTGSPAPLPEMEQALARLLEP